MRDNELLFLLQQSREKNLVLGITGMLLYKGGNFMQMLEGEKQTVLKLYETIRKDDRHKDVVTIMTDNIQTRNFADWSMGFANMDQIGNFPKYDVYIEKNLALRDFQEDSRAAYRLLTLFNRRN